MKKWLLQTVEVINANDNDTYDTIVDQLIAVGRLRGKADAFTLFALDECAETATENADGTKN